MRSEIIHLNTFRTFQQVIICRHVIITCHHLNFYVIQNFTPQLIILQREKERMNISELRALVSQYKPIQRYDHSNEYLCPSKRKIFENDFMMNSYRSKVPLTFDDITTLLRGYSLELDSIDGLIFLYLIQFKQSTRYINEIDGFCVQYMIETNQDVINCIQSSKQSILNDQIKTSEFNKYLFDLFSVRQGMKRVIEGESLQKVLHLLYSSFPLFQHFLQFLNSKNITSLGKDVWICLCTFSHVIFQQQEINFYLQYSVDNVYCYPLLFDDFFMFMKQFYLSHSF